MPRQEKILMWQDILSYTILATWYTGDDPSFDVKNIGVEFTIEASGSGVVSQTNSIEIYRT